MMNLLRSLAAHSHQGSHTVSRSPVEAKASLPQTKLTRTFSHFVC